MPLSDFVGLVLISVIDSPARNLPPTNSLPPLLWPAPDGLIGMACGDCGDCGGLSSACSGEGAPSIVAPGLKLKLGRASDLDGRFSCLGAMVKARSSVSRVDLDLLPVALDKDEGADEVECRVGKTK